MVLLSMTIAALISNVAANVEFYDVVLEDEIRACLLY